MSALEGSGRPRSLAAAASHTPDDRTGAAADGVAPAGGSVDGHTTDGKAGQPAIDAAPPGFGAPAGREVAAGEAPEPAFVPGAPDPFASIVGAWGSSAPVALALLDDAGAIAWLNAAFQSLTGFAPAQALGRPV